MQILRSSARKNNFGISPLVDPVDPDAQLNDVTPGVDLQVCDIPYVDNRNARYHYLIELDLKEVIAKIIHVLAGQAGQFQKRKFTEALSLVLFPT